MVKVLDGFCRWVDNTSEWTGKVIAVLYPILTLLVVWDVFTRYVLNTPWYYMDFEIQLMALLIVVPAAYTHLHNGHVAVDTLVSRFSARGQVRLRLALTPLAIAALGTLLWMLIGDAIYSLNILERESTAVGLPVFPLRIILAASVALWVLEETSKFIGNLRVLLSDKSGSMA